VGASLLAAETDAGGLMSVEFESPQALRPTIAQAQIAKRATLK
jgi:hypothetical protein